MCQAQAGEAPVAVAAVPDPWAAAAAGPPLGGRSVYLETYGCQMNVSDSEVRAQGLELPEARRAGVGAMGSSRV